MDLDEKIIKLFSLTKDKYCGIKEEKIVIIENKLNIRFPEVLRNFYLLFGRNKKLNINDDFYKIEDIYIEDGQFLVIGKQYYVNVLFGIKLKDIKRTNPSIYEKKFKRDKTTHKHFYEWCDWKESVDDYLFEKIIHSGLYGGFKYCFDYYGDQPKEIISDHSSIFNNDLFIKELNEIPDISFRYQFGNFIYYTIDYNFILHIYWSKNKIDYINFGTENKEEYQKMVSFFRNKGINIEKKKKNYSSDYEIYKESMSGPIVRISQGKYSRNCSERGANSIFLYDNAINKFYDLLIKINDKFDIYCISIEYNEEQVNNLINELSERLHKMKNERNFHFMDWKGNYDYYNHNNVEFRRYKKQIIILFADLIKWLKKCNGKTITIFGI